MQPAPQATEPAGTPAVVATAATTSCTVSAARLASHFAAFPNGVFVVVIVVDNGRLDVGDGCRHVVHGWRRRSRRSRWRRVRRLVVGTVQLLPSADVVAGDCDDQLRRTDHRRRRWRRRFFDVVSAGGGWRLGFGGSEQRQPRTFLLQEDVSSADLLSSLHRHAVGSDRARIPV